MMKDLVSTFKMSNYAWLSYACNERSPIYSSSKCKFDIVSFWIGLGLAIFLVIFLIITRLMLCLMDSEEGDRSMAN
uniref:9 kDa protein n=1 Tax=Yam virus 1 TaxID=3123105 RepID=A0AAU6NE59_9CLOS